MDEDYGDFTDLVTGRNVKIIVTPPTTKDAFKITDVQLKPAVKPFILDGQEKPDVAKITEMLINAPKLLGDAYQRVNQEAIDKVLENFIAKKDKTQTKQEAKKDKIESETKTKENTTFIKKDSTSDMSQEDILKKEFSDLLE